jgi:hypothetical protein
MLTRGNSDLEGSIRKLAQRVTGAGDETAAREAYRDGFAGLRAKLDLYPEPKRRPSDVFESASATACNVAASSLPLGIAVVMHLYPLCALQHVPIPLLSAARYRRAKLMRDVRNRSLILANAGSERVHGPQLPVLAKRCTDGVRVAGTFEYMSLGSVADIVLFAAPLANSASTVLCAADLRRDTVRLGALKFRGNMRLSDTSSVAFLDHWVPLERCLVVPGSAALRCISDYQRCWFQLFLTDVHLARLDQLRRDWGLKPDVEQMASINEVSRLREYSLRLLDEFPSRGIVALSRTTAAMKLRVSLLARATMDALQAPSAGDASDTRRRLSDAGELRYIRTQPTADEKILRGLEVEPDAASWPARRPAEACEFPAPVPA